MEKKGLIGFIIFASISNIVIAGPITIPHTFTKDTPAVASEVNQNFSAAATGINGNAQDISKNNSAISDLTNKANGNQQAIASLQQTIFPSFVVKSNNVVIGRLLGVTAGDSLSYPAINFVTPTGFMISMAETKISGQAIGYTMQNCSGDKILLRSQVNYSTLPFGNIVNDYNATTQPSLLYVTADTKRFGPVSIQIASTGEYSITTGPSCINNVQTVDGYNLTPNDETITGVNNLGFSSPITIE